MPRLRASCGPASRTRKNPADAWLQLAAFYRKRGRLDDMQKAVQSAVAQPGKPAESYFDAANELYLGSRDFPGAAQYLQKYLSSGELVEGAPAFHAHYLLGQLEEKMGQQRSRGCRIRSLAFVGLRICPCQESFESRTVTGCLGVMAV